MTTANVNFSDMSEEQLQSYIAKEEAKQDLDFNAMSEEELQAFITQEETVNTLNTTDEWDTYLWNQAKLGLGDSLSMGSAALDVFLLDPLQNIAKDPSVVFDPDNFNIPFTDESQLGKSFINKFGKYTDYISQFTGADPSLQTTDKKLGYLGTGVRTATDPLGYVGAPLKAGQLAARAASLTGVGVGSALGGDVGEELGGTQGRIAGSLLGGVLTPTLTTLATQSAVKPATQIWKKYKEVKANPHLAEQAYATGASKRLLKLIAKEQGVDDIDDIVKEFNRLGKFLDGKELPLMVAMSDNPIVQSQIVRLAKTDEAFRHQVNKELQRLATQIDNKSNIIFGSRYAEISGLETAPLAISKKVTLLKQKRVDVDAKLEELADVVTPTMTEQQRGTKILSLLEKREQLARAEMSPHYTEILRQAKAGGVKMPSDSVRSIYSFVKQNRLSDVFGKGTALDNKLTAFTKPRKVKLKTGKTVVKSPEMSFEQVDSLKRAINALKRKPMNATEQRRIAELEGVIDSARDSIPGGFSERLKAIDKMYYEKVGVPFGTAGMKQINAKKYAEEVVPVILKNETALDSFLVAAGKEGKDIARNAYIAKVYDKVVKDGVVNSTSLKALMKKDSSIINKLPGLKEELEKVLVDNGRLFGRRDSLNAAFKKAETEVANNFLITSNLAPNYSKVAQRVAGGDIAFLNKIKKDVSSLDIGTQQAVNKNIQREFLNLAFDTPSGALKFLTNPKNKKVVSKVFEDNKTYISNVKDLSKMSDALNKADVGRLSSIVTKEDMDIISNVIPGLDVNYASSTFRDRISSPVMKATRILSRINQEATRQKVDKQIIELLQDPKGVEKLAAMGRSMDFKIDNPLALKKISKLLGDTLPAFIYSSSKAPLVAEEQKEEVQPNLKY